MNIEIKKSGRFELLYGYKHCFKENRYLFGFTDTEEEAQQWVEEYSTGRKKMPGPNDEESRGCPATYCPLKGHRGWFAYRDTDST